MIEPGNVPGPHPKTSFQGKICYWVHPGKGIKSNSQTFGLLGVLSFLMLPWEFFLSLALGQVIKVA